MMMKIATLLFTYKRYCHTEKVIHSLKQNTVMPHKLFVFQDGLKQDTDIYDWKMVNKLIYNINWCNKEIIVSEYHKGLANSILYGINYVFREYDAIIVIEDDCVTASNFMSFMNQCLEKYRDNRKVYAVSGYSWPVAMKRNEYDIYGCGRISSWGWGTWKESWQIYAKDYELIKKMRQEETASRNLAMWGSDLLDTLIENVKGNGDSWAVFWALNVILKEGICICPYETLIKNIGLDGSGTHCGKADQTDIISMNGEKEIFYLPEHVELLTDTALSFAPLYGSYTAANQKDTIRKSIIVYGMGKFYFENEKEINEKYNIIALIDKNQRGWFAGKKIITINDIKQYTYDDILLMIWDTQECMNVVKKLAELEIKDILIGYNYYEKQVKSIIG